MLFGDNIKYSFYICQQIKELTIMINEYLLAELV